jgi:hypothetical protein
MSTTTIVIYVLIAAGLIYDAVALAKSYESTISWTLYSGAKKWPIIPLLFGIVMGHLFWSVTGPGGGPAVPDKPCEVKQ